MLQNATGCLLLFVLAVLLAIPLGRYMCGVYQDRKTVMDVLQPFERLVFRVCRIDPAVQMNWKQYLTALITINAVWVIIAFALLLLQGILFLNPAGNPAMEWTLAVNAAVSFLTSTNLQHYAGETGATYLSQLTVFMFLQFVSAATSLAAGVAVVRGLLHSNSNSLGNFYGDFLRSLTRVLIPLSIITAVFFMFSGMPMTFKGVDTIASLQGDTIHVARGPVAAMIPIKELGSNGGGFFGANDAHPFENPGFFTYCIHTVIVLLLPMSFIFFAGYSLQAKKFARMLFAVMTLGFLLITIPIIIQEVNGNPRLASMGISQAEGNMEGKEIRFGSFYSAFYSGVNISVPAGTLTGMHDSYMPLSGVLMIAGMQSGGFFGGLGTGWINIFIYLIIAVFIATLMIGRTPEIFGKKLGLPEMKVAVSIGVLQILVPLVFTAVACFAYTRYPGGGDNTGWLSNKGSHGFTTFLYEYISSVAGNGSEFSGLGNNTAYWNLSTAMVMLSGRFVPIVGAISIAGWLKEKPYSPPSSGSLKIDSATFGLFLFMVIIVLSALSLFPALMTGPIAEHYFINSLACIIH